MYRFEIFRDQSNQYRFRFVAPNNKIMFASEAYKRKGNCKQAVKNIIWVIRMLELEKVDLTKEKV